MQINPQNTTPNFGAKFLYSDSLKQVADYAKKRGAFTKLNQAQKNLAQKNPDTRILVDLGVYSSIKKTETKPYVEFSIFEPVKRVGRPKKGIRQYELVKKVLFESQREMDPLKFAYNKILGLGKQDINNKIYKRILPD